jgi:hypothetical protein
VKTATPRAVARWCVYAVALLLPGSFVVMPVWWYLRHRAARRPGSPNL